MNITIKINCDDAAFDDNPHFEINRILRALADRIEQRLCAEAQSLHDLNGNRVGQMEVTA